MKETPTLDFIGIRKGLPGGYSLGELEARVMRTIYDTEKENPGQPVTANQVFKKLYPELENSYSTITLTMGKLAKKGLLSKSRVGDNKTDQFLYNTTVTEYELARWLIESVCLAVIGDTMENSIRLIHEHSPEKQVAAT